MTATDLQTAGIPIPDSGGLSALYAESALDYIANNTSLKVNKSDSASIKALPASAKLFVIKYGELMETEAGISSESLGGMSQSFESSNRDTLLLDLANSLLGPYMKSQMRFAAAKKRWR